MMLASAFSRRAERGKILDHAGALLDRRRRASASRRTATSIAGRPTGCGSACRGSSPRTRRAAFRRSASDRRAAAPYRRRFISALYCGHRADISGRNHADGLHREPCLVPIGGRQSSLIERVNMPPGAGHRTRRLIQINAHDSVSCHQDMFRRSQTCPDMSSFQPPVRTATSPSSPRH